MIALLLALGAATVASIGSVAPAPRGGEARAAMVTLIRQTAREYPGLPDDSFFNLAVDAVARIDRSNFVPKAERRYAYQNTPLPIGFHQTISDPYIVTIMTAAVRTRAGSNILEIGTGSGYQAAVLSQIGATVHSVEIVVPLALSATRRLRKLGFKRVSVRAGDGFAGWPAAAPYDGIIVTAGAARVPGPLVAELRTGGRLVMPIGANTVVEQLIVMTKRPDGSLSRCSLGPAMFVPLTGRGESVQQSALYDRTVPLCYKGQTAHWPGQPAG